MRPIQRRIAAALLAACAGRLSAQSVRGTVTDAASAPVRGALVQLIDSASHVVARQLTGESGAFRLTAPAPGTFRLQGLRIGYSPSTSEPLALGANQVVTRTLALSGLRVVLDTMRISDRGSCKVARDVAASTLATWEQVRTALTATQISLEDTAAIATTVAFERRIDPRFGRVRSQSSNTASGHASQPWTSTTVSQLRRIGYVHSDSSGTTYEAPGLDVLLSDSFLEDHCVHLVEEPFGIAFEPTRERRKVAEIRGTLMLDRQTFELKQLTYRYANVPSVHDRALGIMDFARLSTGAWVISRWSIRMPVVEQRARASGVGRFRVVDTLVDVSELLEHGALLSVLRRGADTLWAHPSLDLTGVLRDSASGRPTAGAYVTVRQPSRAAVTDSAGSFTLRGLLPGDHLLSVHTADLDSIGAYQVRIPLLTADVVEIRMPPARSIAAQRPVPTSAVLTGLVLTDSSRRPIAGVEIALSDLSLTTTTSDSGTFQLRDVPPGTHQLMARKLGYGKVDTEVTLRAGATARREILLARVVTLDSVAVVARAVLPSFEEHRRMGLGQFLTRDELAKQEGRTMSAILGGLRGTRIMNGSATHSYIAANRPRSIDSRVDNRHGDFGSLPACYANVYLDNMLIYSGKPIERPFDLNTMSPDRLEAVEYYSSPAQIPNKYMGGDDHCGILVLWTRRTFDDKKP